MPTRLDAVLVDARDPGTLASWWAAALGWPAHEEEPGEVEVAPPPGAPGLPLLFEAVAEPKRVKNRLHLDLATATRDDQAATVERLVTLGASHVDIGQRDVPWVVLADPEGNEFCVLTPR